VLALVDFLQPLMAAERSAIGAKLRARFYNLSDALPELGTVAQSLFIVANGVFSVARVNGEAETEMMRLGSGDHSGEIGILTGARAR
jgi:CRP-like cAMP-binding protein